MGVAGGGLALLIYYFIGGLVLLRGRCGGVLYLKGSQCFFPENARGSAAGAATAAGAMLIVVPRPSFQSLPRSGPRMAARRASRCRREESPPGGPRTLSWPATCASRTCPASRAGA